MRGDAGPSGPWILVLGGCTRPGNRRARRHVPAVLERGFEVVWLDGFEERVDGQRVPVDGVDDDTDLLIVGVKSHDVERTNRTLRARVGRVLLAGDPSPRRRRVARWAKRSTQIGRSRRLRRIQQPIIEQLSARLEPSAVVYCDDLAIATAWHLSRRWPHIRVASDLDVGEAP